MRTRPLARLRPCKPLPDSGPVALSPPQVERPRSARKTASKSRRRPSHRNLRTRVASLSASVTPMWIPKGAEFKRIPPEVQAAVSETIQPAYEQLVLRANHPLDRSLGHTLVHLLWLEVLEQYDLGQEYLALHAALGIPGSRGHVIDQHLRLIDSKLRVGYFLHRIREIRRRNAELRRSPPPRAEVDSLEKPAPVDQKTRLPPQSPGETQRSSTRFRRALAHTFAPSAHPLQNQ